jgi:hypothetical protein
MTRKTCEKWQAAKIAQALFPFTNYLVRQRRRMEEVCFLPDDDFFRHVCAAFDAVNRLRLKAHNLSCGGTGTPSVLGQAVTDGAVEPAASASESPATASPEPPL